MPPWDAATRAIFEQRRAVGQVARRLYPDGVEAAPGARAWPAVAAATHEALAARRPLFEAGFVRRGGACQVDILVPVGDSAWDLLEVKQVVRGILERALIQHDAHWWMSAG